MLYSPRTDVLALGDGFYDQVAPAHFPRHEQRYRNARAVASVGLSDLDDAAFERSFARIEPLPDNLKEPLSLRYHGHQFGVYNPQLGDGRGFLFAQLEDASGRLLDLGTKGSGQTPWSRGGDGRLTLKGGVREVLATSMLEALGVDTSKTLSLFETGESLRRHDEPSPTRASVLVRLSHSHVRFGTFQRFFHARDEARLRKLFDYAVSHFYPDVAAAPDPIAAFLSTVASKHAATCAAYMVAGFVHGVLNTDNMNITGESFDYGPYRFLPKYDPDFVAAYFDESGLYAYGRQPGTFAWNLTRLSECLRLLSPDLAVGPALALFESELHEGVARSMLRRLGLRSAGADLDRELAAAAFAFLESSGMSFDRFFFDAYGGAPRISRLAKDHGDSRDNANFRALVTQLELHDASHPERASCTYLAREAPATLVINEVERVWSNIAERDDWSALSDKLAAIEELRVLLAP
jgi:uncharacterized protein YdiU (UPF0061 family)